MASDNTSILRSVKKVLGFENEETSFDDDILMHINTVLADLNQIGVGPAEGFEITGEAETWDMFIPLSPALNSVKTYIYLRLRLLFDPPPTSFGIAAFEKQIEKHEWRLNVRAEEINRPVLTEEVIEP